MSATNSKKTRIALLFGGRSPEHSVSCVTAAGILRVLDPEKYDVVPIGITRQGQWTIEEADPESWSLSSGVAPEIKPSAESLQFSHTNEATELIGHSDSGAMRSLGGVDVVFPVLHGSFGEDGTVQGLLEMADVSYVGSGVAASAIGMDKHFAKLVFEAAGLEVGPYEVITDKEWQRDRQVCLSRLSRLEYPLFVKPARAGSSVGVSRVSDEAGLVHAIDAAREHDPKVIIEQGIAGREIECGVLEGRGSDAPRTSLPGEIEVTAGADTFYDFNAKYVDGGAAELTCPAALPEDQISIIREQASIAFDAIGGEGLARVDFFYTDDGRWIINEINTMPGFTPVSMYPRIWGETGIGYAELVDELIWLAVNRKTGLR
ncbi:D-alanine--D-alanine ligase family protein [Arthrobacter rhombi]|uniref:D-alanine--D-alanine ligase family protein n=1 Tax=Arthrobacter rhombi TaxID=71253 RepID=UPI003FD0073D